MQNRCRPNRRSSYRITSRRRAEMKMGIKDDRRFFRQLLWWGNIPVGQDFPCSLTSTKVVCPQVNPKKNKAVVCRVKSGTRANERLDRMPIAARIRKDRLRMETPSAMRYSRAVSREVEAECRN
ncbi:hypothetical protein WR25_06651 [Diploscapter pachys]|uniref:Uncharacterized protein n=1 Tax=Diploscapter pachys TaxID=2018661 RepID=A0A2A2JUB0_9BILA|nr:hypothetical protein WR25_06651 [Diploscapter pachys]